MVEMVFGTFGWEFKKPDFDIVVMESPHYDDCLEPCFCGYGSPHVTFEDERYHIVCERCGLTACISSTFEEAIDSWNHVRRLAKNSENKNEE